MPTRRRAAAAPAKKASAPKTGKRGRGRIAGRAAELRELVSRSISALVDAIHQHTRKNMAAGVRAFIAEKGATVGRIGRRGRRPGLTKKRILPCIAPGCTNTSKGPRFHYLCEKHMNAPKRDYEAWRLKAKAARA